MSTTVLPAPYRPAMLRVRAVLRPCPSMVEVVFEGELEWLASHGLDQRVKLLVPSGPAPRDPRLAEATDGSWYERWRNSSDRDPIRTFTIVRPDPERGRFSLLIAQHHPAGVTGTWLATAAPGDAVIAVLPDARSDASRVGIEWRCGTSGSVLVGDESALPAIANIVAAADSRARPSAFVEVPTVQDAEAFRAPGIEFAIRGARPYGEALAPLLRDCLGLRAADDAEPQDLLWEQSADGQPLSLWVAGESAWVRGLRRSARARATGAWMGYWRRGLSETA